MTDIEREFALVVRRALRKKRAYGLVTFIKDTNLLTVYPKAKEMMRRMADRRLVARRGIWVANTHQGLWISMNGFVLDMDEEYYLQIVANIIKKNKDEEDDNWDRSRLR